MPSQYGINIELHNASPTDYAIDTSTPIAIVGDDTELRGLYGFNSIEEALAQVKEGSIKNALKDLESTGIRSQIVLSAFEKTSESESLESALNAIAALKKAEADIALKPKFILAPEYNDSGIWERLKQVATTLRAVYAIELNATTEAEIKKELETLQTHRAIISFQKLQRIDKVARPASAFLIALYAKVMASSEYGFAQTYSNRVIDGVIGVIDSVEYLQGEDCEADRLRAIGITCVIVDNGIRAWGRHTRDTALGLESLHSIVIFDRIIDTIFEAQKEAIDKQVSDMVKQVQDDLDRFYRKLVANKVLVGYNITLPTDLNTNESIAQGEIYIRQEMQEMPILAKITNKLYRVTNYSQELIKEL